MQQIRKERSKRRFINSKVFSCIADGQHGDFNWKRALSQTAINPHDGSIVASPVDTELFPSDFGHLQLQRCLELGRLHQPIADLSPLALLSWLAGWLAGWLVPGGPLPYYQLVVRLPHFMISCMASAYAFRSRPLRDGRVAPTFVSIEQAIKGDI